MSSQSPTLIAPIWDKLFCLTLPGQETRQQSTLNEFQKVRLPPPDFFYGVTPRDQSVSQLYKTKQVTTFPTCFRCNKLDCGKTTCNNVLLPVQIAVTLSFRAILQNCVDQGWPVVAICEDDIVFSGYAAEVFDSTRFRDLVNEAGLRSEEPTLIRLGSPNCPAGFFDETCPQVELSQRPSMSNYMFVCNAAFAALAVRSLSTFEHTADMLIHERLINRARCYTLNPQLVCDRSWGLRNAPSQIHPKIEYVNYLHRQFGAQSSQYQQELARLREHKKRVDVYRYGFVGFPNLDEDNLRQTCSNLGVDLGGTDLAGKDGYVAWDNIMLERLDLVFGHPAPDRYFWYAESLYYVVPDPVKCIIDLAGRIAQQDKSIQLMTEVITATHPQGHSRKTDNALKQAAWLFIYWSRHLRRYTQGKIFREGDDEELLKIVKPKANKITWTPNSEQLTSIKALGLPEKARRALIEELENYS
ncbi:hypothetical protein [Gilvimarinus sp. 1_MG-2023]|uniref:hypothetical protein n=1 Tax=Gilvimarinus sp. 1_MG-2023 TaxID=3062638 RepID=UPI0026E2EC4E|nr:hypothetical protein [Gilvimarinus sp. 1_MG-2023]MDO6746269.1 hypothetical protein [Gilvimarinus sp. 1_MG-2023]